MTPLADMPRTTCDAPHPATADTAATDAAALARQAHATLAAVLAEDADELVRIFYDVFLRNEEASRYLTHQVVQERLGSSLRGWLLALFAACPPVVDEAAQRKIGEVHAHLGIPIHLVLEGASLLKSALARRLIDRFSSPAGLGEALMMIDGGIDLAMRHMSAAYVTGTRSRARAAEAYRLFSLGQDIAVEREGQRAALMEWSQGFLLGLLSGHAALPPLSASPFGLWLRHRALMLFEGSPELERIGAAVAEIDTVILPGLARAESEEVPALAARLQLTVEEIKYLLNEIFQQAAGLEQGSDPLTRTLNRRFLPTILAREVAAAGQGGAPLSLLMIDVDHFKSINDAHGHASGDAVLRQVAERVLDSVRPTDFVFRYGGEEFLALLVEADAAQALAVAERMRQRLAERPFRLPDGSELPVTASLGLATHDGHPDYQFLVDVADKALYRAKHGGRNRVVVA